MQTPYAILTGLQTLFESSRLLFGDWRKVGWLKSVDLSVCRRTRELQIEVEMHHIPKADRSYSADIQTEKWIGQLPCSLLTIKPWTVRSKSVGDDAFIAKGRDLV